MGKNGILGLVASSSLGVAGTWIDKAQPHLGLIALVLSIVLSVVLIANGLIDYGRKMRESRLANQKEIDEAKRRAADELCQMRRNQGYCPLKRLAIEHEGSFIPLDKLDTNES
jgi:hypothetical protein